MATGTQVDVVMPQMGVSVSEGTITKWLKQPGESIAQDEPLLEISTDKVDTEVPSPGAGVVQEILVQEGETVEVGTRLAVIAPEGSAPGAPPEEPAAAPRPSRAPHYAPPPEPQPEPVPARCSAGPDRRLPPPRATATPATGPSSLRSWRGSQPSTASTSRASPARGRGGRVTKKDILAFVESGPPAPAVAPRLRHRPRRPRHLRRRSRHPRHRRRRHRSGTAARHPSRRQCRNRGGRRRDPRADERHAQGHRRAHAPLARHLRARDERDRGRHVQGGHDPREAEARVPGDLRRQPDLPRLRRPRDDRHAAASIRTSTARSAASRSSRATTSTSASRSSSPTARA